MILFAAIRHTRLTWPGHELNSRKMHELRKHLSMMMWQDLLSSSGVGPETCGVCSCV